MNAGRVVPVSANDGMTQAEADFYAQEAANGGHAGFGMRDAYLTPDVNVSDGFQTHQSLVMAWSTEGNAGNDVGDVAAWEYHYGIDPDLTGLFLDFSLFAPNGVWDVSVELIDINGRTKAWFLPGPAPNWANVTLNLSSNAAMQGGFLLMLDPLFDITMVTAIRFDESGIWSMPFPLTPAGIALPPGGPNGPGWNAWNHVRIIPEPSTLTLAGIAALGSLLLVKLRGRRLVRRPSW